MPPWKPEPGFGSFHDERRLSDARDPEDRRLGRGRRARGERRGPSPAAQVSRRLAARHARPRAQSVRAVRRAGARGRHLSLLRDSDPDRYEQDGRRRSSSARATAGSCTMPCSISTARGRRVRLDESEPGPGYTSFGGPGHTADRRTGRLGPRLHAANAARRHGQVPPQGERPGSADSLPPRRQARERPVGRRHLFHEEAGPEDRGGDRGPDAETSTSRPENTAITRPRRARLCPWTFRRSASRRTCTTSARK